LREVLPVTFWGDFQNIGYYGLFSYHIQTVYSKAPLGIGFPIRFAEAFKRKFCGKAYFNFRFFGIWQNDPGSKVKSM
jgi:hypothetical protein